LWEGRLEQHSKNWHNTVVINTAYKFDLVKLDKITLVTN
jgi:hypothetical protein